MRGRRGLTALGAAGVTAVGLIVTGCGSSSSPSSATAAPSASGTTTAAAAATGTATTGRGTASASKSGTAKGSPFSVLFIGDQSGPAKLAGSGQIQGLRAAAQYLDSHGGVDGHPVTISVQNDGGDGGTASSLVIKATESSPPDLIYAGTESSETTAMYPVLSRLKELGIAQTDGANSLATKAASAFPEQFDSMPGTATQDKSAAAWFKAHGYKKVGILQSSISLAEGETATMEAALKAVGISPVLASFPATAVDVTPEMSELKSDGADAVYAEDFGAQVAYTLNARASLAWKVPIVGDLAFASINLADVVGHNTSELDDVYLLVARDQPSTASGSGLATFKRYWGHFKVPAVTAATSINDVSESWDALLAVAAAADNAKSMSGSAIAATLEKLTHSDMPYATISQVGYSSDDHQNVAARSSDFPVIKAGKTVNGQIVSGK
jgi:branched-chain amino acid transport system substrate-binding protein